MGTSRDDDFLYDFLVRSYMNIYDSDIRSDMVMYESIADLTI